MKRLLSLTACIIISGLAWANTIVVRNILELKEANRSAKPGDIVILENGRWNDVSILLDCNGTKDQPITFKARTAGKVLVTGNSRLKLGGNYIVVDGLYFVNGYAGKDAVIDFRINKEKLANNCRVTNCAIDAFNNPKRMDENIWISFSGKNNRLDHCSFYDKKNMGVVLAVILDDERSRENFHRIDHNHFGLRQPLASNGGEIIRIGVSQHCQFNSNTIIADNFFDRCDGETEIVSIKSGSNVVKNNLFLECQGGVVLRHGDNNTVENNVFAGNGKEGTGGVRVINRGQWVVNNLFYRCRGVDFRSPLSVMNGVPNSPAHRYVQVTEAVIANNSFFQTSPVSFCEGSDTERSMPPAHVFMANNIFYNDEDTIIYKVYDNISGFNFSGNKVSRQLKQATGRGFEKSLFTTHKAASVIIPRTQSARGALISDSLQQAARKRLGHLLSSAPGFSSPQLAIDIKLNAESAGASWFSKTSDHQSKTQQYCATAEEVYKQLETGKPLVINLTGKAYTFTKPLVITSSVVFRSDERNEVAIATGKMLATFVISGNGHLSLTNLKINGTGVQSTHFIASDTSGGSAHYNLAVRSCSISNLDRNKGCQDFFFAFKSMVADSIIIRNNHFANNNVDHFVMNEEKDNKGYYNAEKIVLTNNNFSNSSGSLLDIYRGGNDESTLGPQLFVVGNNFTTLTGHSDEPFIQLTGVQKTRFISNTFNNCFEGKKLFVFKDIVRADHWLETNIITRSGEIEKNGFVKIINAD